MTLIAGKNDYSECGGALEQVPRKAAGSPSLGTFKTQLDEALSNLLSLDLIEAETSSDPFPSTPVHDSDIKPVSSTWKKKSSNFHIFFKGSVILVLLMKDQWGNITFDMSPIIKSHKLHTSIGTKSCQ